MSVLFSRLWCSNLLYCYQYDDGAHKLSWPLFDRIRAFAANAGVNNQDRVFQDQSEMHRIMAGRAMFGQSYGTPITDPTGLQFGRLQRYTDYDQMDEVGEANLALDIHADEASLCDPETKHSLIIKAASKNLREELEELFFHRLLIDNHIWAMVRYLCKYGDQPCEIVPTADRKGVAYIRPMNVYNFTRVETKYGDLVGFYHQEDYNLDPIALHPWSVMHMRLMTNEHKFGPYGCSIMEGGRKGFKQLRLMEDAALIYRVTRAPERRIFTIPVGNLAPNDILEFMAMAARQFKNNRFYDPKTGQMNERFSPMMQEDDYYLPVRPDGTGPKIATLDGAENLDQIKDILYFKKKMIAPMKIPFRRVGLAEGDSSSSGKPLSAEEVEFARAIQRVQREVVAGLTKVAICHLSMAGFSADELRNFSLHMTSSNTIDELYRIEAWASRASVMSDMLDLKIFPKAWIVTKFTDLTEDEIIDLNTRKDILELRDGDDSGGGIGGLGGSSFGGLGKSDSPPLVDLDNISTPSSPSSESSGLSEPSGPSEPSGLSEPGAGSDASSPNLDVLGLPESLDDVNNLINENKRLKSGFNKIIADAASRVKADNRQQALRESIRKWRRSDMYDSGSHYRHLMMLNEIKDIGTDSNSINDNKTMIEYRNVLMDDPDKINNSVDGRLLTDD